MMMICFVAIVDVALSIIDNQRSKHEKSDSLQRKQQLL